MDLITKPARVAGTPRTGRLCALLVALAGLMGGRAASASDLNGFVSLKGLGAVGISYTEEGFDEFWVGRTRVSDPGIGRLSRKSVSLWLSYGLTDRLTITANLPYIRTRADGFGRFQERSLQDLVALGSYRIASGGAELRSTLVGAAGIRKPIGDYRVDNPGDVGDGTTDALLRIVYRMNYRGLYVSQQVGLDLRGEDAPDSFPFYTEAGMGRGRVTLSAFYGKVVTLEGTDIGQPGFTFPSNREEYDRLGGKVYVQVNDRLGVSVLAFKVVNGRNTSKTSGVGVGLFLPL